MRIGLAVALFLSGCGAALAQTPVWTQFLNSPAGTARNDDIYFADQTNGWSARGTDGVYRTFNSGQTWNKVITNLSPIAHFRCIGFASATHGWAGNLGLGSYDTSVSDTNMLYETFDGGSNWSAVASINASGMQGFCAIHVMDAQHIYGAGRVRGPAFFAKSENGGGSWWVTNLTAAGVMGGLMDVYFKDATNGFIVGMDTNLYTTNCVAPFYHGAIARTTNGGLSWSVVASTPVNCSYFWKMSWPSSNIGYASLQQNSSYSAVVYYKTIDGGATWTSNGIPLSAIGSPASFGLQGIGFISDNEGWMGGTTVLNPPYSFIHTTNGGLNWTSEGYNNTRSINRIRFVTPALGYMSGQTLHVYHVPLAIHLQPTNQVAAAGSNVIFNVSAYGTAPLLYQWRFNGVNLSGASGASLQSANPGYYDVVISDFSGSVTSSVATLNVAAAPATILFADDFDAYNTPSIVTNSGTTNGYKIFFNAASGPEDFKAIFGFDYSTVTYPTTIAPAPNSANGTTKGLYLAVNKDANGQVAAVNFYPLNQTNQGNFSFKFDLWLNGANLGSSTEHAIFGINHSGQITNRIGLATSDGLFFAVDTDGNVAATTTTMRDYAVYRGGGGGAIPVFMTTNNTVFGPTPLLGPQFDNLNSGFMNLFPSKTFSGWGSTLAGSAGLGWVRGEVRQVSNLITWLLNDVAIAQYTNTSGYTNGSVMIGYSDNFPSIGDANSFAIYDNVRVEGIPPVKILYPYISGNNFAFTFITEPYDSYTVQWTTNLTSPTWASYTNFIGTGGLYNGLVSLTNQLTQQFFRVSQP